jgi:caffeoyl-CoA O-methyltransferase
VTGAQVITLEQDPLKARLAQEPYREAGVDAHITLMAGDAGTTLQDIPGPFNCVFIDAWKPDYVLYFDAVWSKVRPGGLVAAPA